MNTTNLDIAAVRECLRLLRQPPDERLLRRYVDRVEYGRRAPLSASEKKWVEANLSANARWQHAHDRVRRSRKSAHRLGSVATRLVAAAVVLLAGPFWILSIYQTTGPAGSTVQRAVGYAEEAIRGDGAPSLKLPDTFVPFELPAMDGLRDLRTNSPSRAQLHHVQDALRKSYNTSDRRVDRAEIAYVIAQISVILDDLESAQAWLDACEAEDVFDCVGLMEQEVEKPTAR